MATVYLLQTTSFVRYCKDKTNHRKKKFFHKEGREKGEEGEGGGGRRETVRSYIFLSGVRW